MSEYITDTLHGLHMRHFVYANLASAGLDRLSKYVIAFKNPKRKKKYTVLHDLQRALFIAQLLA